MDGSASGIQMQRSKMISTAMKAKTAMDCGCFGNIYLVSVITKSSLCFLAAFPMHPGRQLQPVFQNIIQLIHTNLKYWEIIKTIAIKQSVFHNRICHISPHCFVFFYFTVSKYPIIPMHTSFFIGDHSVCNFILYI